MKNEKYHYFIIYEIREMATVYLIGITLKICLTRKLL